jgi:group I intron endonuclease
LSTIAKFRIELHVKDFELLNSIRSYFNDIGQLEVISTRKLAYFEVTKLNDLVNIVIPHFDKYPLQSVKSIDYLLWKQCISLMVAKAHLTQSGLEKIISIKAVLFLTFSLFFNISELSLIPSFLAADIYEIVDSVSLSLVSIIIYSNAETDKSKFLKDNKGRAAIYMWTHKESGKRYVGSAVNLSDRMYQYFSLSWLKQVDSYISRAIIFHTHSAFSLSILEYVDVSNLDKEDARKLILSREQHFLDLLFSEDKPNTYNILKVAGSLLGFKHSEESIVKMRETRLGVPKTEVTKIKMSEAKTGDNHPMFGNTHSEVTKGIMSKAKGGGTIYVYDTQDTLVNTFISARKAAEHFDCNHKTIIRYVKNGKIFKEKWFLSMSLIINE